MCKQLLMLSIAFSMLLVVACHNNSNNAVPKEGVVIAPASDCLWAGGSLLEYERFNFQFGDTNVAYWAAVYKLPEEGA